MRLKVEFWGPQIHEGWGVKLSAKCKTLFSIKYLTIWLFPTSIMDRISDKIQYPVPKCFTEDNYLNCFFREMWRMKNGTWDYMYIQCLCINARTYLLNINVLIFRVGEISYHKSLSQNVSQILVKQKIYCIR